MIDERALPTISVIIPMLNAAGTIRRQLDAVLGQQLDEPFELLVADNGSADASRELVVSHAANDARLRLVDVADKGGPGAVRNAAVAQARGSLLAFCDADDMVSPGWLDAFAKSDDGAAILVGPLDESWFASRPSRWQVEYGRRRPLASGEPFAPAGNFAVSAQLFRDLGGFPDGCNTGEDIAFSRTAWTSGIPIRFVPGAIVYLGQRGSRDAWRAWVVKGVDSIGIDLRFPPTGASNRQASRDAIWACLRQPLRNRGLWITLVAIRIGRLRGRRNRRGSSG
jgi:glycosyltransferase involved in cell wall biosynthesis